MILFVPSSDTRVIVNTLLDVFERRDTSSTRAIQVRLRELNLPAYFSQQDPEPRMITNQQMQTLANSGLTRLKWIAGEENHLLESIILPTPQSPRMIPHELYTLLHRTPLSSQRAQLESLLLAEKFRFSPEDWRARALNRTLDALRAGKSPSPFSLSASDFNADLLTALLALSALPAETPQRVFSVHVFNDTKRFEDLRPALIRLARQANPEWKSLSSEDLLRELNLVANPGYIHLSGSWQFTTADGEVLSLDGFFPSIGFPAAQVASIQTVSVHADAVVCIENLTSFYEFIREKEKANRYTGTQRNTPRLPRPMPQAVICLMGNPSPAIRRLLRLIPEETNLCLWSDMDYGGFNILAQLRKRISARVEPYLMDISTFEKHAALGRPLTQADFRNLKRLALQPHLRDVRPVIEHLIRRGLKLEQEAIDPATA